MAVVFKTASIEQFAGKLGLLSTLTQLSKHDIKAVVTSSAIKFARDGEVLATFPIPLATVKLVSTLGPQAAGMPGLVAEFEALMVKLWDEHADLAPLDDALENPPGPVKTPLSFLDADKKKAEQAAMGNVPGGAVYPTFPLDKLETAIPVKLRDANQLYQPVAGSSNGSRYFLMAAASDLKIAARLLNSSLSLRVEGSGFHKHVAVLQEVGFTNVSTHKEYASMHLDCSDLTMVRKALGAVLAGTGVALATPLPDVQVIRDKGK